MARRRPASPTPTPPTAAGHGVSHHFFGQTCLADPAFAPERHQPAQARLDRVHRSFDRAQLL